MLNRKGISSIIGTLIFIGILFSAVAPMFLVMRQADVLYETTKKVVEADDSDKKLEKLLLYGYGSDLEEISVRVQNKGFVSVQLKRVWFNDRYESVSTILDPSEAITLGPFNVSHDTSTILVKVSTAKGNIISSDLGNIYWDAINGWYTPSLGIAIHILNEKGKYQINVNNTIGEHIFEYESDDIEWDDIDKTVLIGLTDSPCTVTIKKKIGTNWEHLITNLEVFVPNNGNYIVHVVADGR